MAGRPRSTMSACLLWPWACAKPTPSSLTIILGAKPGPKLTTVQFRQQLIDDLLRLYPTPEFSSPQKKQRTCTDLDLALSGHRHVTKPLHAGDFVGRGPGLIEGFRRCKKPYQQQACQGARCGKACRTYCACDPAVPLCATCYALHLRSICRVKLPSLVKVKVITVTFFPLS